MISYVGIFEIFCIIKGNFVLMQASSKQSTFKLETTISDVGASVGYKNVRVSYPFNLARECGIRNFVTSLDYAKDDSHSEFVVSSSSGEDISEHTNEENRRQTRIVGGYNINITSSPSSVAILKNKKYICVGNLLSHHHVLTAAHCVTKTYKNHNGHYVWDEISAAVVSILAGETYLENKQGDAFIALKIDIHPGYLTNDDVIMYRDVAVVTLEKNVVFSSSVATASIHPNVPEDKFESLMVGAKCFVAGWGSTLVGGINEEYHMKEIILFLMSMQQCKDSLSNQAEYTLDSTVQVCAFGEGSDACQGDGGSGLFSRGSILAVTSFGEGCASTSPGIYARVDTCREFIDSILNNSSKIASSAVIYLYLPLLFSLSL